MASLDDCLRESMAAHKAGRFTEAEEGYRRVLAARPADPKALYYLGLLHFHRGEAGTAIELMQRCVALAPSNAHAWNTLGGLLVASGHKLEAMEAYRRATEAAPAMGEGWYNHAVCLRDAGDFEGALARLRAGIEHEPGYFKSYEALATLLYQLGRMQEAASVYLDWAMLEPQNPVARHMAAAASQQNVPARAADDYVRLLFDRSAASFDSDLERLGYRAPQRIAAALAKWTDESVLPAILDAGCGTGLCGPLLRQKCASLAGVDISPLMIDRARARSCYDELVVAELSGFMRSRPASFDAIVSADTLVYFGSLEAPLSAAREALRTPGLLVFTLESLPVGVAGTYSLGLHGRYAHGEGYVRRTLATAGLELRDLSLETLREERELQVRGYRVVAART